MILIVTNHDKATASNHAVCHKLSNCTVQLMAVDAVKQKIHGLLIASPEIDAVLIGHGSKSDFIGNDDASALSVSDVGGLPTRKYFALACATAEKIGPACAGVNSTWVGFAGTIHSLMDGPNVIALFRQVPQFAIDELATILSRDSASLFIEKFDKLIDDLVIQMSGITGCGMDEFITLRLFKERLRVWLPGATVPMKGSEASEPVSRF